MSIYIYIYVYVYEGGVIKLKSSISWNILY